MAKLVSKLSQSLDGYVDHLEMQPGPVLFLTSSTKCATWAGGVYGRRATSHAVLGTKTS